MSSYRTITCVDCGKQRTVVRNGKPPPQRCTSCAQPRRKTNRAMPTNKISSDKARLRDRFLEQFRDTPTPCKKESDMWVSAVLAQRNSAKKLCRTRCSLLAPCYAWANEPPREKYGVLGGRDWTTKEKT